ncbi:MAG: hypothetical protein PHU81_08045 [Acidobacteriota bacterium]|nr:hypothetical protein [Acidobacteriota bacterium]
MKTPSFNHYNGLRSKGLRPGRLAASTFYLKLAVIFCLIVFLVNCASTLSRAKVDYAQAQTLQRTLRVREATAIYKKVQQEMSALVKQQPTAQAYLLKGLSEVNLELWEEAAASFQQATWLGNEGTESWAKELSLYGLALSFEKLGWPEVSARLFDILVKKGKYQPVVRNSVGKLVEKKLGEIDNLARSEKRVPEERNKILDEVKKMVLQTLEKDPACGYCHYLLSQVLAHREDFSQSLEEAIMARELGLPTEEILRDNDNQIIFCYKELIVELPADQIVSFKERYNKWIKKWEWPDETTPDWKKS